MSNNNIQGFKVLPLRFSTNSTSCHSLFIKEHSLKRIDQLKPQGKTLFVLNVPPYATKNKLKVYFSKVGNVKNIIIENDDEKEINDGFKRAFVVYEKRESLLKVMKLDTLDPLPPIEIPLQIGLEKWIEDYNSSVYDPKELQKEVNMYIARYDNKDERQKMLGKEESVDDEGWTVVTKKGRRPGVSRKESVNDKVNKKNKSWLEKKQLKNFYTFQIRESKMEHIATLRKNFEEAKNKINLMKKARRFKPY